MPFYQTVGRSSIRLDKRNRISVNLRQCRHRDDSISSLCTTICFGFL
ncbi:hypothetical protein [Paraprevotella xylaniphila]|uniref:Uncharacterized protein n=1 Tax=Paraprevotella xylaniphila YIT 11841 TaxID=762982 RepID=F3QX45_9BACT|nr:hypothetical protein [Paraprevotella xylaniphila]EGG51495.1 hypothetical protein HMPREF9442_02779 [Paraprevotella xylaniphila YIT 11841]